MQWCHATIKELRQAYQKAREATHRSGAAPKICLLYQQLYSILCSDSTSTTKNPLDTSKRLEAEANRVIPRDKVVDEEVELEEDVGHVTGSSCGHDEPSQDLFLDSSGV